MPKGRAQLYCFCNSCAHVCTSIMPSRTRLALCTTRCHRFWDFDAAHCLMPQTSFYASNVGSVLKLRLEQRGIREVNGRVCTIWALSEIRNRPGIRAWSQLNAAHHRLCLERPHVGPISEHLLCWKWANGVYFLLPYLDEEYSQKLAT